VGVYGALSAGENYCLVDGLLYSPKDYVDKRERCLEAGIPEEKIVFKTKSEIALD